MQIQTEDKVCVKSCFLHYTEYVRESYCRPVAMCRTNLHKKAFLKTRTSKNRFHFKIPLRVIGVLKFY